jgi:hypothetical protein
VKIQNKAGIARTFDLRAIGLTSATLQVAEGEGSAVAAMDGVPLLVKPDSVATFHAYVHAPKSGQPETGFVLIARAREDGESVDYHATFRGPTN